MSQWKALVGRVSLFPASPTSFTSLSALSLYRSIWNGDPDNFQKQANPLAPTIAQGRRGEMAVTFSTHPTRIDLNLSPAPPAPSQMAQMLLRLIEDTSKLHTGLIEIIDAIGRGTIDGSVARVALNLQFLVLQQDFVEANKILAAVIPDRYGIKIADERDLIFQINQPYASRKISGIRMNAVTKWSVDQLQILTFSVQAGGTGAPSLANAASMMPQTKIFTAASVNFDINSNISPDNSPLSCEDQSSLLREALATVAQKQQEINLNVEGF